MALKDVFKISFKTYLNPAGWMGFDELKGTTRVLWSSLKTAFTSTKPHRAETFEAALKRKHITEEALRDTSRQFLLNATIFVICGAMAFTGSFYLLIFLGSFFGWLLGLLVTLLFLTQAFRFHFWYFQIKHRKLGCTFKEWWNGKPFDHRKIHHD